MEDKILIWLGSRPLISVNRLCKMVDYNMSNFQKSAKQGIVPQKIRDRLVGVLSEYGYSETIAYETPKVFDAPKPQYLTHDEFIVSPQPIRKYSLAEYNDRIEDAYGFIEDQKKIAEDIRNDENNLTLAQKRDLLARMGLTK
jgi:hypothetical protein